jgi:predicted nucleic acid-binding protein
VRFWDSSAIVPLLVGEASTAAATAEYQHDPQMMVWWATEVECVSALARMERDASLGTQGMTDAIERLAALARAWQEIQPVDRVRQTATRLLRVHGLRAADALQLGAAIAAAEDRPETLTVVTLDERLARAAEREGFKVVIPSVASA